MPKLTIDGMEVTVEPGTSIIQAAEQLGVEIPRFCYHDKLSVPANCRMCLVQVEGGPPKPAASCALPCADNMVVHTQSEMAKKARKGVMEMLLINHPLDCPICDQGGECDLQDQAVAFGFDRSRYTEEKRAVRDKELGPLVKTVMTRCIHCTRCVRFGEEIAGVAEMGVLGRGEHLEIGTYVEQMMTSELSGNIIDICPVGALTNKPYAFRARPWELRKTESVDVLDAVGSNIRVDVRGGEVMRILPRLHEDVNEEWISDKTRFALDGLKRQRLDRPYVRNASGRLVAASWDEAFDTIANRLKGVPGSKIAALTGDLVDCESVVALKDLMKSLESVNLECRQDGGTFDVSAPCGWTYNTTIAKTEMADAILLVGCNPRVEAAMINARIRKAWMQRRAKVGVIGPRLDLNYPYQHLGAGPETLQDVADGKHAFSAMLKGAQNPMIILGSGALARTDGMAVQALGRKVAESYNMIREDWNGFNLLHTAAGRMGALMLGFVPGKGGLDLAGILDASAKGTLDVLYLLGADEFPIEKLGPKTFVVYQGHHGDRGAARADVILPGAAYTEKDAIYINTEGRVQMAKQAVFPPGEAKEDWKILRALSARLGKTLPYDSLVQIRKWLSAVNPAFARADVVVSSAWTKFGSDGACGSAPFHGAVHNFYMTDPITRSSGVMAQCTKAFIDGAKSMERTGSHG